MHSSGGSDSGGPAQYASPPCFLHELQPGSEPGDTDPIVWADVERWRKAERVRLIEARLAIPAVVRGEMATRIADRLDAEIGNVGGKTVSLYWPFRGEPDLRPWMASVNERGGRTALPVVVEKAHPLVFRAYRPGDRLEKGVWNIPIPAEGESVVPDVVISPLQPDVSARRASGRSRTPPAQRPSSSDRSPALGRAPRAC
jgi:5-formyltetrahydrofolate cyclo-ligase